MFVSFIVLSSQLAFANAPLLKALQKLRVAWGPTPQATLLVGKSTFSLSCMCPFLNWRICPEQRGFAAVEILQARCSARTMAPCYLRFRTLGPEDEEDLKNVETCESSPKFVVQEDDPRRHDCKGRLDQREAPVFRFCLLATSDLMGTSQAVFNFKQQKLQTDMEMHHAEITLPLLGQRVRQFV